MSMKSSSAPRRLYVRNDQPLVCFGGKLYGASSKRPSKLDPMKTVRIEVLKRDHGKSRIAVTQGTGDNAVTENWTEQHLVVSKRS